MTINQGKKYKHRNNTITNKTDQNKQLGKNIRQQQTLPTETKSDHKMPIKGHEFWNLQTWWIGGYIELVQTGHSRSSWTLVAGWTAELETTPFPWDLDDVNWGWWWGWMSEGWRSISSSSIEETHSTLSKSILFPPFQSIFLNPQPKNPRPRNQLLPERESKGQKDEKLKAPQIKSGWDSSWVSDQTLNMISFSWRKREKKERESPNRLHLQPRKLKGEKEKPLPAQRKGKCFTSRASSGLRERVRESHPDVIVIWE